MYVAKVTIAGIYGTFPEGEAVAGVSEPILKSWLDGGIIEEVPDPVAAAETVAVASEPVPDSRPASGIAEPGTFASVPAPFYPEAQVITEVAVPVKAGKKTPSAPATKA